MLQRVDLQHHIKTVVAEDGQAVLQIELQHVHAAARAGQHIGVVQFHAIARTAALAHQMLEQRAVATTQVQHACALGHQLGNGFHGGQLGHAASPARSAVFSSLAMPSK
ncbi:hypothetical protein SDC9_212717 [bioreactor metagenome]|uniref:Uncharacterized protein n=1 Tax=bioreactor metagenome TaxID=1076179 RepID=A0A645JMQ4_9ZZZZ